MLSWLLTVITGGVFAAGVVGLQPTPMHLSIVEMTTGCMGATPQYTITSWAIATSIIDMETGEPAYGVTVMDPNTMTARVYIERGYWLHPTVISHEVTHAITGRAEDEMTPAEWRCVMQVPTELGLRPAVSADSLRALELATGGRG
jgi:hypothetical protein